MAKKKQMRNRKWRLEEPEERRKPNRKLRDESGGQELTDEWARLEKAGIVRETVAKKLGGVE